MRIGSVLLTALLVGTPAASQEPNIQALNVNQHGLAHNARESIAGALVRDASAQPYSLGGGCFGFAAEGIPLPYSQICVDEQSILGYFTGGNVERLVLHTTPPADGKQGSCALSTMGMGLEEVLQITETTVEMQTIDDPLFCGVPVDLGLSGESQYVRIRQQEIHTGTLNSAQWQELLDGKAPCEVLDTAQAYHSSYWLDLGGNRPMRHAYERTPVQIHDIDPLSPYLVFVDRSVRVVTPHPISLQTEELLQELRSHADEAIQSDQFRELYRDLTGSEIGDIESKTDSGRLVYTLEFSDAWNPERARSAAGLLLDVIAGSLQQGSDASYAIGFNVYRGNQIELWLGE